MTQQIWWGIVEDFAAIEINGLDAEAFLQGQLTCDVASIKSGQTVPSACCDYKGRMQANGWIGRIEDRFILFIPSALATLIAGHLHKFAVFSKVQLIKKNHWQAIVYCDNELVNLPIEGALKGQAYSTHWLIAQDQNITRIKTQLEKISLPVTQNELKLLLVQHKIAFVVPPTRGLFIPQMFGLEKIGGVSFQKGCYVGQEVIARTQHLGQLKRQLQILKLTCSHSEKPAPGEAILDGQREIMGNVAAIAVENSENFQVLAVVQDRALTHPLFTLQHKELYF